MYNTWIFYIQCQAMKDPLFCYQANQKFSSEGQFRYKTKHKYLNIYIYNFLLNQEPYKKAYIDPDW
jgi:hypothetical protein